MLIYKHFSGNEQSVVANDLSQLEPVNSPSGGWSMPPFFSQLPMGWISDESTRRQKSFLLSLPSSRRRRRAPVSPTTVAMQVEVVLRGSCASSFMPALNSFSGGVVLYRTRGIRTTGLGRINKTSTRQSVNELDEDTQLESRCLKHIYIYHFTD